MRYFFYSLICEMNNKDAMEKNFSLFMFINSGINLSSVNLKLVSKLDILFILTRPI